MFRLQALRIHPQRKLCSYPSLFNMTTGTFSTLTSSVAFICFMCYIGKCQDFYNITSVWDNTINNRVTIDLKTTKTAFEPFIFYKASGNGMWFDVKTSGRALVGLTKVAHGSCQYWIEFSNPGQISINGRSEARSYKAGLPFTLSDDNYSRFWVAWDAKFVWAGIGHSLEIVISSPISSKLNYITFTTKDQAHPCTYKFEVPPLRLREPPAPVPNVPEISAGMLQWKRCDNQLPDEAVVGGHIDGEIVYVVRAHHRHSLTPGVFVPSKGLAYVPWGGSDNPTSNFEALCGSNLKWKPASEDKIPVDAFVAGYSEQNEPLYIGRALVNENKIPGKITLSSIFCNVAYPDPGRQSEVKKHEVLTEPGLNIHSANKYLCPPSYDVDDYDDDDDEPSHNELANEYYEYEIEHFENEAEDFEFNFE